MRALAGEGISESPENAPRCGLMGENRKMRGGFQGKERGYVEGRSRQERGFHRIYE